MFEFLYYMSNRELLFSLILIFVPISIFFVALVKYVLPVRLRYRDNPVIGNISAIIGIIYGVLAGLTALYLINNISYTADAVQSEANAIANIYRDSLLIAEPTQTEIKIEIKNYLKKVVEIEWPLLQVGKALDGEGENIIKKMSKTIYDYNKTSPTDSMISTDMLQEVKTLYNSREQRIHMSFSQLNSEIWIVILIGTILTLAVNFMFRMDFTLHIISVSAVAIMAAAMIFLLITLDRPFQGEFVVDPGAFQALGKLIEKDQTEAISIGR